MHIATKFFQQVLALLAIAILCTGCGGSGKMPLISSNPWQVISLATEATFLDVGLIDDTHGWLIGTNAALFETTDGGNTWNPRSLDLDSPTYRFTSVSFSGSEGWIVGEPAILLHTTDEGRSWSRIALSEKLPGVPNSILALGANSAEMTTNVGAIYRTTDGGKSWKALVEEAVGVLRNIARAPDGKYVAVSSRGNFYSTWEPGQAAWEPHNRNSSRRVQNMGFTSDGRLWMLARGGQLQFSHVAGTDEWENPISPSSTAGWGLLDLSYRTPNEAWITGGSGNLLRSLDGGTTWEKDPFVENVPSNFYKIKFFGTEKGFILGQRGILLKYGQAEESA